MKLKVFVAISLIIFVIGVTAIITAGMVSNKPAKNIQVVDSPTDVTTAKENPTSIPANSIILTAEEVAKHNSETDCWQIINNKVYDVTKDLATHPGGAETMIPYCGKEATEAYDTKDKPRPQSHSQLADEQLNAGYIGDLDQSVTLK